MYGTILVLMLNLSLTGEFCALFFMGVQRIFSHQLCSNGNSRPEICNSIMQACYHTKPFFRFAHGFHIFLINLKANNCQFTAALWCKHGIQKDELRFAAWVVDNLR